MSKEVTTEQTKERTLNAKKKQTVLGTADILEFGCEEKMQLQLVSDQYYYPPHEVPRVNGRPAAAPARTSNSSCTTCSTLC